MAGLCFALSILCFGNLIILLNGMSKIDWAWEFTTAWSCLFNLFLLFYFLMVWNERSDKEGVEQSVRGMEGIIKFFTKKRTFGKTRNN